MLSCVFSSLASMCVIVVFLLLVLSTVSAERCAVRCAGGIHDELCRDSLLRCIPFRGVHCAGRQRWMCILIECDGPVLGSVARVACGQQVSVRFGSFGFSETKNALSPIDYLLAGGGSSQNIKNARKMSRENVRFPAGHDAIMTEVALGQNCETFRRANMRTPTGWQPFSQGDNVLVTPRDFMYALPKERCFALDELWRLRGTVATEKCSPWPCAHWGTCEVGAIGHEACLRLGSAPISFRIPSGFSPRLKNTILLSVRKSSTQVQGGGPAARFRIEPK